ncbi:stage II sporulation protein P [Sporomusa acidovorans]|uniref:stage II sporulation protein P n=1 Tax=Sporomusa acidovorans TaxID=112900 RepID=UPI00088E91E9|nr:stage II sporulation protein P [Sporomusa acidovorans]OZC19112.1 stage II sporulation protein SpoIIP [Sporomusa acidovorans DSM 3132]SDD67663.1 stage II sporulation protein P [Sporomusa acidovorans]
MPILRLFTMVSVMILASLNVSNSVAAPVDSATEVNDGFVTITDTLGKIIFQTGLAVHPGDEFIDEDNRVYAVTSVQGTSATAEYVREESISGLWPQTVPVQAPAQPASQLVSIYHTHTDESYIPTDGKATVKGDGSILLVGEAFSKRLSEVGYQTTHDKTLHDPHDANAYQRSRRTVMKLLQQQPAALFDIHRDSAPAKIYNFQVNGQDATKILLVVGRQNQNINTTMNYAKTIKAAADAKYKGLVRGIFIAKSGYNQDLNPRSILIEIGTQYNSREAADRSAALFADVVPSFLAPTTQAPASQAPVAQATPSVSPDIVANNDPGPRQDTLLIIGALVAGTGAFLFLSTGSFKEAKSKLLRFGKYEFGDIFRSWKKRK